MTTARTKLCAALKAKFASPGAVLRALGLDKDLVEVGKPASGKPVIELAGDDENLEQFRNLLRKAGLSEEDIAEALRLAAGGNGEATDRLPTSGPGGLGGAVTGRIRSPGERVFAADASTRGPAEKEIDDLGAGRIIVGADYSPDRHRSRPASWPDDRRMAEYHKMFGGEHIAV